MPGNPRDMITVAERRFPVRIRIGVPPGGFGQRYAQITAWLDENCGADGWAMTPSGMRGVLNDAVSIYFLDATLASAFVARWCAGYKVETAEGVFSLLRADSRQHVRRILWPGWRRSAIMGVLKSVEPTGFLARTRVCGNKLGGCESADHPKLPARPRTSLSSRLFGSGFAGLGFEVDWRADPRHVGSHPAGVPAPPRRPG